MGYVYFITDGHGHVKIGKADDPEQRLKGLQTGNAYNLEIYELIEVWDHKPSCFDAQCFEHMLHRMFSKFNIRDEWFLEDPVFDWLHNVKKDATEHPKSKQSFGCFHQDFKYDLWVYKIKRKRSNNKLFVSCVDRIHCKGW